MLQNIPNKEIQTNQKIKKNFLKSEYKNLDIKCNIFKGNFYLDSFNFFPISYDYYTFSELYKRNISQNNDHFFTKNFYEKLLNNLDNLKKFDNLFLLGSNPGNNYYSNLIHFLPRIFFNNENNIKIGIHRNSSIKYRNFIKKILKSKNISFTFIYLDDDLYNFTNTQIPQFLSIQNSVKLLKNFLLPGNHKFKHKKIYVTREGSDYRKILNEADLIPILKSNGYRVINPQLYEIHEQIQIFSEADKIVSIHGSNLTNIIFCKPGTEIVEIIPNFVENYEKNFLYKYKYLSNLNNLNHNTFTSDTVSVEKHSKLASKYISKEILENSNYYKNLIVKVSDIKNILI
tara:strand:- start:923 stop:1954 length:1032 start_codon:yes stop_codon:yes gene_type:complete